MINMKNLKFLILGAVATGLISSSAMAAPNSDEVIKQDISNGISSLLQEHYNNGFLKEKAIINVQFIKSSKNDSAEPGNMARLIANECKISLAFENDGSSPQLATEESILNTTKFQNEKQKQIMREFIALHENFHCDFTNIENPIRIEGKSKDFNKKINFYLKDILTVPLKDVGQIAYIDTLNENFADIAATGLLIKKYGESNPDLLYVLNANKTQRHAKYFENDLDSHLTHIGLEKSLSKEVIDKFINAKDGTEFQDIALDVANKSVQQLMTQRKDLTEEMFSFKAYTMAVMSGFIKEVNYLLATEDQKNQYAIKHIWKSGISKGLTTKFAEQKINIEDIKKSKLKFNIPGVFDENTLDILEYVTKVTVSDDAHLAMIKDYKQFSNYTNEFKKHVYSQNKVNINNFDSKTKEQLAQKMLTLRNNFLESTNNHNNNNGWIIY